MSRGMESGPRDWVRGRRTGSGSEGRGYSLGYDCPAPMLCLWGRLDPDVPPPPCDLKDLCRRRFAGEDLQTETCGDEHLMTKICGDEECVDEEIADELKCKYGEMRGRRNANTEKCVDEEIADEEMRRRRSSWTKICERNFADEDMRDKEMRDEYLSGNDICDAVKTMRALFDALSEQTFSR